MAGKVPETSVVRDRFHLGCVALIKKKGDEHLRNYMGILISQYKDPEKNQPGFNGK